MLDLFLNLVDRFRSLVEFRKRQDERLFDELLVPLFGMFKEIHDDYVQVLYDVEQQFASTLPVNGMPQAYIASVTTTTLLKNVTDGNVYHSDDHERRLFNTMAKKLLEAFRALASHTDDSAALRAKLLTLRAGLERNRLRHDSTRIQLRNAIRDLPRSSLPEPVHELFGSILEYFQIGTSLYRRQSYDIDSSPNESSSAAGGLVRGIRDFEEELSRGLWEPDHLAYLWSKIAAELAYVNHEHRRQWGKSCVVFERLRVQMKACNSV
jgi:hypothetical protein